MYFCTSSMVVHRLENEQKMMPTRPVFLIRSRDRYAVEDDVHRHPGQLFLL